MDNIIIKFKTNEKDVLIFEHIYTEVHPIYSLEKKRENSAKKNHPRLYDGEKVEAKTKYEMYSDRRLVFFFSLS